MTSELPERSTPDAGLNPQTGQPHLENPPFDNTSLHEALKNPDIDLSADVDDETLEQLQAGNYWSPAPPPREPAFRPTTGVKAGFSREDTQPKEVKTMADRLKSPLFIIPTVVALGAAAFGIGAAVKAKNDLIDQLNDIPVPPVVSAPVVPGEVVPPVNEGEQPVVTPPELDKNNPSNIDLSQCAINAAPGDVPTSIFCGYEFSSLSAQEQQSVLEIAALDDTSFNKLPLATKIENANRILKIRETDGLARADIAIKAYNAEDAGASSMVGPLETIVDIPEEYYTSGMPFAAMNSKIAIIKQGFTVKNNDGTLLLDKTQAKRALYGVFVEGTPLFEKFEQGIDQASNTVMADMVLFSTSVDGTKKANSTVTLDGKTYNLYTAINASQVLSTPGDKTLARGEYDVSCVPVLSQDGTTTWLINDVEPAK